VKAINRKKWWPILIFLGAAIRDVPTELQGGQPTDSTGTEAPADPPVTSG
jgi:hypothetical protein